MATISENLLALNETKQAIKTAIEGKGQDLTGVPFTDYATKISEIVGGSGKKFTTGTVTFTTNHAQQIVTHNLGVVPSIFIIYPIDTLPEGGTEEANNRTFGSTNILVPGLGRTGTYYRGNPSTGVLIWGQSESFGNDTTNTETTIQPSYYRNYAYVANFKYGWIAIE